MKLIFLTLFVSLFSFSAFAESAYERVMRTGEIRCGYVPWDTVVSKDPQTEEMQGIIVDIMEEAARLLEFEVKWTEELGWATTLEAIRSNRVDAICTGFWRNPTEGKHFNFSTPLFYSAVGMYVRADDMRFSGGFSKANDSSIKISTADGSLSGIIAQSDFPLAQRLELPNMVDLSQPLIDVSTGKADVTFANTSVGTNFMANNPGEIKNIATENPIRIYRNTIGLPQDDHRLKVMIDSALIQLLDSGFVKKTLQKHEPRSGIFLNIRKPYEVY